MAVIKETIKALKGDGNGQVSGPKNQNGNPLLKRVANQVVNQGIDIAKDIASGKKTVKNGELVNSDKANVIEETIGGNNYNLMDKGQFAQGLANPLNGTGHVAGIPQGPQIQPLETQPVENQPEKTETPIEQQNIQKQTAPVKQNGVSSPKVDTNPNAVYDENGNYLGSSDIVNGDTPQSNQEVAKQEINEQAVENMKNDLAQQGGKIYGRSQADENNPSEGIDTLSDPYGIEARTNQARISNMSNLQKMDPHDVAVSIVSGVSPYGDQAMRDLMQYDPERYKQIQEQVKAMKGQETIDGIMETGTIDGVSQTTTATNVVNNGITNWANGVTSNPEESSQVTTNLMNTMASNQVANTATQEMLNINKQIAEREQKLKDLPTEAKKAFKGDVPQYLYDAYISNRTQQYQAEINKLESRYNSALDLYKTELANAQWQEEMKLKYLQYQQGVNNDNWTRYYQSQQLLQNNIKWVDGKAYKVDPTTGSFVQLTDQTAYNNYNQAVSSALQGYASIYTSADKTATSTGYKYNITGGQCETFTDNFTEATTGLRMEGANGRGWTTAEEKVGYINSRVPEIGSVAVAVGGAYDSTYGHTMLVTGYNAETGIVDLLWSNKNGDQQVYESHITLDQLWKTGLKGFWNPYQTAQEKSIANYGAGVTQYGVTVTPMTQIFDQMIQTVKDTDTVSKAEQAYTYLYEMVNDGSLAQLINSGDIGKIMAYMSKGNFGEKDDEGAKFANRLKTYIEKKAAKELTGGDDSLKALNKLVQLVETKLRKESGAAINSSEWLTNFEMYLPQAGESSSYSRDKMRGWDSIILRNLRSAGLSSVNQYIPIFGTNYREVRAY